MPAGEEFENFAAIVWAVIFLVGGFAMWSFFYHVLHEKLYTGEEQNSKKNKVKTQFVLAFIVIAFFVILFGNQI